MFVGKLGGVRSFPAIYQISDYEIDHTGDSITFVSDLDVFYDTVNKYSGVLNSVGDWFDNVITEVGVAPYDIDKPMIRGVIAPMSRSQSREDFNDTTLLFNSTLTDYINSLYQSMYYTYMKSCGNEDCGILTDTTIIKTIDGGSITDTNITY